MIKRDRHLIRADFMRNLLINFILQFTICVISFALGSPNQKQTVFRESESRASLTLDQSSQRFV